MATSMNERQTQADPRPTPRPVVGQGGARPSTSRASAAPAAGAVRRPSASLYAHSTTPSQGQVQPQAAAPRAQQSAQTPQTPARTPASVAPAAQAAPQQQAVVQQATAAQPAPTQQTTPHIVVPDNSEEAIKRQVWAIIDRLPQRGVIEQSDARQWVDEVVASHGKKALWHAARAGGFGGSQIGVLVRNFHGIRADFQDSAHDIVEGSLLRRTPDKPTAAMQRGISMEAWHRQWFLAKYAAQRDAVGFEALSKHAGPQAWMRYSPDELCIFPQSSGLPSRDGRLTRVLVDYKSPTSVKLGDSVSFQYACQLHLGRLVAEHNNVAIDAMMLSQFDWGGWSLKDDFIEHDAALDEAIMEAGNHYWNEYVMRGQVPAYINKPRLENAEALQERLYTASYALATMRAVSDALSDEADKIATEMRGLLGEYKFGNQKLPLNGMTVTAAKSLKTEEAVKALPAEVVAQLPLKATATKKYDEKAMVKYLKDSGVDVSQFVMPGNIDPDALSQALIENGQDVENFEVETLRIKINAEHQANMKEWTTQQFSQFIHYEQDAQQEQEVEDIQPIERPSAGG